MTSEVMADAGPKAREALAAEGARSGAEDQASRPETTIVRKGVCSARGRTENAVNPPPSTSPETREEDRKPTTPAFEHDILDHLLEGCRILDFDYRYLYVNEPAAAQARCSREEMIGRTMQECFPGIEQTPMFAALRRCMEERTSGHTERDHVFPDGSRPAFEISFVPVPQGLCVLSVDVTERRHLLGAIVHDSADAIISSSLDGIVTHWNPSAERIFGYAATEMVGRPIDVLFPQQRRDEDIAASARMLRGEIIAPFEAVRRHRDGREIEVSVALSPIRDFAGTMVGLSKVARDISEVKEARRELLQAKEKAEAAHRELESFSYSVAHDLRAPLRSIDGFSQALLDDHSAQLDEEGRRLLSFVRGSAQLMARLIDDILALSRVTRSEIIRSRVDLSSLAGAILQRLRASASERAVGSAPERTVDVVLPSGLVAQADPRLLEIVLENLLGNAWKFSSRRAAARIEVGQFLRDDATVTFVRDNGAGFDPAFAHKLFGVFQRLHSANEFEGTGIGLATVQRAVHRHGGEVWAEGAVDAGAAFFFTLGDGEQTR